MREFKHTMRAALLAAGTIAATLGATPLAAHAQQAPGGKHHSKLEGALVGGAVGSAVGHPKLGAAAGAMHQHGKNKKAGY